LVLDLGPPRLAAAKRDRHADDLEVGVEHDDGQAAEPALAAADLDAIAHLAAVAADLTLAEHRPAVRIPLGVTVVGRRLVRHAVDLDLRAPVARNAAVADLDPAHGSLVAAGLARRKVDDARARAAAERVAHVGT